MAQPTTPSGSDARALALATMSFALSFAAWGLVGGLASVFADLYDLTASQTALLVAVPVLLGSLARLPMGMLTDRFGGRAVFTLLLLVSAAAAWSVPLDRQLSQLCWRRRSSSGSPDRRSRSAPPSSRAGRRPHGRARRSASTGWARWGSRWRCSAGRWSPAGSAGRACSAASACCCSPGRSSSCRSRATRPRPARPAGVGAMVARAARDRQRPGCWARSTSSPSAASSPSRSTCRRCCARSSA